VTRKEIIPRQNIAIDKVGIGKGAYDIINRQIVGVRGVNAGEKLDPKITGDPNDILYFNLRAKIYWKATQWIIGGGKLEMMEGEDENNSVWYELAKVKYRTKLEGTHGKIQIMPKEVMIKEGIESPDIADSLTFTFVGPDFILETQDEQEEREARDREEESKQTVNPFNPFEMPL
jgi:hypothetical protein